MTKNTNQYHANIEAARHNREMERLTSMANAETARSNAAREFENQRSNRANERNTAYYNQQSGIHWSRSDAEANRANLAQEALTSQRDTNTYVSNSERNSVAKDTLTEQSRANRQREENERYSADMGLLGSLIGAAGRVIGSSIMKGKGGSNKKKSAYQKWQDSHPVLY